MQGADREYGQSPEMFLPESMRIFSFRGCLFIWSIIYVIAEARQSLKLPFILPFFFALHVSQVKRLLRKSYYRNLHRWKKF